MKLRVRLLFVIVAVDGFSPTRNVGQFLRPFLDAFSQTRNGGTFLRPFVFASKDGDDEKKPFFLETSPTEEKEIWKEAEMEEETKPIVSDEMKEEATKVASIVSNALMEELVVSRKESCSFKE